MSEAEWDIIEQMHTRFSGNYPQNEDGARAWTQTVNEQLKYSFPNRGWCWKKAAEHNPPSKDGCARKVGALFGGWDLLNAAGLTGPKHLATYPPAYHDLTGQVPIEVAAVNHLGR